MLFRGSFDAVALSERVTFQVGMCSAVGVCFSPDGKRVAGACSDGTVKVWEAATGEPVHTLTGHGGPVYSVCFSPDGQRIASASEDRTVKVWDAATGQEAISLKGHTGAVYGVCFSPDGHLLASASADQTVRLWDATPIYESP
jgi:WD40 repeat protein